MPTTNQPTTFMPTTSIPTTLIPTTYNPTTKTPTNTPTNTSITTEPTTLNPSTRGPTTEIPTKYPTYNPTITITYRPTTKPVFTMRIDGTIHPSNPEIIVIEATLTLLNATVVGHINNMNVMTKESISSTVSVVILLVIICFFMIECANNYRKY
eukprot:183546_1